MMEANVLEDTEIRLLLHGVRQVYGYDFLEYSEASLKRRLKHWLATSGFANFSEAQAAVLHNPDQFESLLTGITVNVTEMFRDPTFFLALREKVIPFLKTYPFVRIWLAGCSTGEEAYSMAILLHEAGMDGRYRIFATDINEDVLRKAHDGVFQLGAMQSFTRNYQKSGGVASFSEYYTARYERAILMAVLKEHLAFGQHNLVTDAGLGEMNMILCRNVMIYFKNVLKEHCLDLFDGCLSSGGFLCLGMKERLDGKTMADRYEKFAPRCSIYRKRYA